MSTNSPDQSRLVFNCEPCGKEGVSVMQKHDRIRVCAASNIDPSRTHLNEALHGSPAGPAVALDDLYATGVQAPAPQAHRPYLRIVMSASAIFFRPDDPELIGTWVPARLQTWVSVALAALRARFGDDLVHVSLHLDEDTPHLHVLVAPTYQNKARKVDRRRRGETDAAFEARKAAAAADTGKRTVGRASHPTLKLQGSIATLRAAFATDFAHLGIHPGHARGPDDPRPKTTRQWVNEEGERLRQLRSMLEAERAELPRLKEAAIRAAFAQVHAHYLAEIAALKEKVTDMMVAVTDWLAPLVALRKDAVAEVGLLARIRQAFQGMPEREAAAVRNALHRLDTNNDPVDQHGTMQRAADAELLKTYRDLMANLAPRDGGDADSVLDLPAINVEPDTYYRDVDREPDGLA